MELSRRKKRVLIGVAAFFVFYTFVGFLVLPYAMKSMLLNRLPEVLGRDVAIEKIRFNPYNLRLTITGFRVAKLPGSEPPGDFLSFDELYVNIESPSIVMLGPIVKEVRLTGPYVGVARKADGSYSFSDLLGALAGGGEGAEDSEDSEKVREAKRPLVFSINNIQITGGRVDFDDRPKGKVHEVRDVAVNIPFVSNRLKYVDAFVLPSFSAVVNSTPFVLRGGAKPFSDSLESSLKIRFFGLDLAYYAAYSPVPLSVELASALMDVDALLTFVQHADAPPELALSGVLALSDVLVRDEKGRGMAGLDSLRVAITSSELFSRRVAVGEVALERPFVTAVRDPDGRVNIATALPAKGPARTPAPPAPDDGSGPPLRLGIATVRVDGASVEFTDLATATPFNRKLAPVDITVTNLSTARDTRAGLDLNYSGEGGESLSVDGDFSINPLQADLGLEVKSLDITPVRSYVDERLRIIITRGRAGAAGRLRASAGAGGLEGAFSGDALVSGFASISKVDKEDFLNWGTLSVTGIDAEYPPVSVRIDGVALSDFYSRIIVSPEGRLNVQEVMVRDEAAPAGEAPPPAPAVEKAQPIPARDMIIDRVTLQGGHVNFTDRHIEPGFTVDLLEIGGRVSGLESVEDSYADVHLIGKLDKYAPLEITGRVNPLAGDLFVDLSLDFRNFDLSAMTPYSGKYVGYRIAKGKLILDLDYRIEKGRLESTNSIVLDQITFGEKVDSPQATKLPVKFALNLLKDRAGQVEIDFPVTGSLDDPQFKVGRVIFRVVMSFITRAVTSPFALLGAIIGSGDQELSYVEFDPGLAAIAGQEAARLDSLAAALFKRPGLHLEVRGHADPVSDPLALRDQRFLRAVKAARLEALLKEKKAEPPKLDDVVIAEDEYEEYLWRAYKDMDFPKPKNFLGFTKKIEPEEMKKLMLANIVITGDDLAELASRRADAVREYLVNTGRVEPERVFIVLPDEIVPEDREGVALSRVEFGLE